MQRRTTVLIGREDEDALRVASRAEGVSQSELIRRGIALVTSPFRRRRRPTVGWLRLSRREIDAILAEDFADRDG